MEELCGVDTCPFIIAPLCEYEAACLRIIFFRDFFADILFHKDDKTVFPSSSFTDATPQ
jgi:hypothetical protein